MPRGNRTGPLGAGPMTGRGAGYCAGYPTPGFDNPAPTRFAGFRRGGGAFGWRHMFYATGLPGWLRGRSAPAAPQSEVEALEEQANWLKDQLNAINERLKALGKREE